MTDLEQLIEILKKKSVRYGDFTLASGKKSNVYVDARLTTLCAEAMPLIGRVFLAKFKERGWNPSVVGGLTMGADPVVTAIARESLDLDRPIDAFLVRKEAKQHGRLGHMVGLDEPDGLDAVIVDDVFTTGGSTITAIKRAREAGMNVLGAVALVDREQGGRENFEAIGCAFDRIFTMKDLLEES
jgi:orotate phosphoribosyltransferase